VWKACFSLELGLAYAECGCVRGGAVRDLKVKEDHHALEKRYQYQKKGGKRGGRAALKRAAGGGIVK